MIRKNIASEEHLIEVLIAPERLGNVTNVWNQISTIGNLLPHHQKIYNTNKLFMHFGDYFVYSTGTIHHFKQRIALLEFLLTNETKKFDSKTSAVSCPITDPFGVTKSKSLIVTLPLFEKTITLNGKMERSFSTTEAKISWLLGERKLSWNFQL